ncbi:MAG: hypothetical protein Q9218_006564 [Villophora microphyllina]
MDTRRRGGSLVLSALEGDLKPWKDRPKRSTFGIKNRTRVIWNERVLRDHQDRIRDQVSSMTLLIQVMQMPKSAGRQQALENGRKVFAKSEQSAYSIVPSRSSRSMQDSESLLSIKSGTSFVHHELSIDRDLFASKVYKRSYQPSLIRNLLRKAKVSFANHNEAWRCHLTDATGFGEGIVSTTMPQAPRSLSDGSSAPSLTNVRTHKPRFTASHDGSRTSIVDYFEDWVLGTAKGTPIESSIKPRSHQKVAVLMLCWEERSCDLDTLAEVSRLSSVFEESFGYDVSTLYLDPKQEQRLQVQVNAKFANFIATHDGPNTLLMVYYAGHARPGKSSGILELFG